jgi:hypothetical protein
MLNPDYFGPPLLPHPDEVFLDAEKRFGIIHFPACVENGQEHRAIYELRDHLKGAVDTYSPEMFPPTPEFLAAAVEEMRQRDTPAPRAWLVPVPRITGAARPGIDVDIFAIDDPLPEDSERR